MKERKTVGVQTGANEKVEIENRFYIYEIFPLVPFSV